MDSSGLERGKYPGSFLQVQCAEGLGGQVGDQLEATVEVDSVNCPHRNNVPDGRRADDEIPELFGRDDVPEVLAGLGYRHQFIRGDLYQVSPGGRADRAPGEKPFLNGRRAVIVSLLARCEKHEDKGPRPWQFSPVTFVMARSD